MIKLFFLSSLFLVAGLVHIFLPEVFYVLFPPGMPGKFEIVFLSGILEIFLALGLMVRRSRDLSARLSALYLLFLLPVHVYVSVEQTEIFGFSHPLILWGRTLFQFVLYFLFLSLQEKGSIIYQTWRDVIFLHYKVAPEELQHLVPFPLDLHQGEAVLSVVPFRMDQIRFPFLPWIPGVSKLWELNLRTYVRVNGVRGIYFFTLETDSRIGAKVANVFFHLPYRLSKITAKVENKKFIFEHHRQSYQFKLQATLGVEKSKNEFEAWASECYHLFLKRSARTVQGTVTHSPWTLQEVQIETLHDEFTKMVNLSKPARFISASYTQELSVSFSPFKIVNSEDLS